MSSQNPSEKPAESPVIQGELLPAGSAAGNSPPDPLAWLTQPEREAYDYFVAHRDTRAVPSSFALSPDVQVALFTLYLNGRSLGEIRQQTHPSYGMGQIVHAAVTGDWETRKRQYLADLLTRSQERATQVSSEAINFVADSMSAAHILHGEALRKFMVTKDIKDLGAFGIGSLKQYRDLVELLLKLSGQEGTIKAKVSGTVRHEHLHRSIPTAPPPPAIPGAAVALLGSWSAAELASQAGDSEEDE